MASNGKTSVGNGEESLSAQPALEDADALPQSQIPAETKEEGLLVVGIGASAGGLEAIGELLDHVSPQGRMALIVVQHLAPAHESLLTQILARNAKLDVVTAVDGVALVPNRIYVIPPNVDLAVMHGTIRLLTPSTSRGPHLPIDYTFRSLADDQGRFAIGVVLSGTGTDGTFGLKAIKAAGGLAFVQDPSSAKYDGMPRSALESGNADFCLTPRELGEELSRIAARPRSQTVPRRTALPPHVQEQLGKLFVILRSAFGNDLSHYKTATVERRIERRMTLHRIERLEEYVKFVQSNGAELRALYDDMLITVTSFFRDPDVFDVLKAKILPQIVEREPSNAPIRLWVPACATGEEAYSIAMCLLEVLEEKTRDKKIQIFGTDIDEDAIAHARRGAYRANIAADVSPARLRRFFVEKDGGYVVSRAVRDMVVFSKHNVLKDAPFSRLDLASCRNLLIYLQAPAQKKVLHILHYALSSSGYLLLGSSETAGDTPDLFSPVDRKNKIYLKRHAAPQAGLDVNFGVHTSLELPPAQTATRPTVSVQALADRKVLELYGPPGVIVNEELEILHLRGHTGPYFDPMPGVASWNVLRVARFDLHVDLKKTIQQAFSSQLRTTTEVRYQTDGKQNMVALDAIPLRDPDTKARCLLVLFRELAAPRELLIAAQTPRETDEVSLPLARRIQELELELSVTKEYLQTTIEEKDSTTEELKSANEELQSSNEELQSTNEELETSREEMQSTNEELTTVNDELNDRMAELSQTNDDLHNVLAGVDNAVVIVGMDLRIRRYTSAAEKLFNLVPGDVGRTVDFLESFLGASALGPKVSSVIDTLASVEDELLASNQRWYALRISPYKTLEHSIRGALVSLADIDVKKRAAAMTSDVSGYASRFLGAIGHPLLIVDRRLRIVWCNAPFLVTFQRTAEETVGSLLPSLGGGEWVDRGLREHVERMFSGAASTFRDYELQLRTREMGALCLSVGGSQIPATPEMPLALLSLEPRAASAGRGAP